MGGGGKKGTKAEQLDVHAQTHPQCDGMICQQRQELVKPVWPLPLSFSITIKGAERAINPVTLASRHVHIYECVSSVVRR